MSNELDKLAFETKKPNKALVWIVAIIAAAVLGYFVTGCATILEKSIEELDRQAAKWEEKQKELPPVITPEPDKPEPDKPIPSIVDAVPFESLVWIKDGNNFLGGFNGSGAKPDRITLSNFRNDGRRIWFKYDVGLDAWGIPKDEAGATLACVFFLKDGKWQGGKFDWIRPRNSDRELKHVEEYSFWEKLGIRLPWNGPTAFVIVHLDGKRRSNVVATGVK